MLSKITFEGWIFSFMYFNDSKWGFLAWTEPESSGFTSALCAEGRAWRSRQNLCIYPHVGSNVRVWDMVMIQMYSRVDKLSLFCGETGRYWNPFWYFELIFCKDHYTLWKVKWSCGVYFPRVFLCLSHKKEAQWSSRPAAFTVIRTGRPKLLI